MVLSERDKASLREILSPINRDVEIVLFRSNGPSCRYCDVIEELLADIHSVNGRVKYSVYHVERDASVAREYGVRHGPTILFKDRPNIRYMGTPSGHEFRAFVDDIVMVGTGELEMDPSVRREVEEIDLPLEVWVFVTPTCPYCPYAVRTAHRFAYVNPNIKGVMVEAMEFPELADAFAVSAVPKNVVIDPETGAPLLQWEGALPEDAFAHYLKHALLHKKGEPHEH